MDARERFQRVLPLNFIAKRLELRALLLFQNWKWFKYPIAQRVEKFWQALLHECENIQREPPVVCALLENNKIIRFAEALPDFAELRDQQLSKKWPHAYVRKIISFAAYH